MYNIVAVTYSLRSTKILLIFRSFLFLEINFDDDFYIVEARVSTHE